MEKITRDAISQLVTAKAEPAVTIYMPLEYGSAPPHLTENQIRFKNLIHTAVQQLKDKGDSSSTGKDLCDFLDAHYDNLEFWKDDGKALLICAAPGMMHLFKLPLESEEYVAVDDTFHLAPILSLLDDDRRFYVLALAQQHPKLFEGDMYELQEAAVNLPASLREGLGIDEPNQKSENQGSATGPSTNTGGFNGRGGSRDPMDNDRLKYFHMIDSTLHDKLDRTRPLLLAGIDSEVAEFRDLSKYPKIMQQSLSGNHTESSAQDLFTMAMPAIHEELVQPEHQAAREEYERLAGANPDRVAHDKESIMAAAEQGRIDKLLAQFVRNTTDTVTDRVAAVLRISFPEGDMSRTMNHLASTVWQMSGKVINLQPTEMPHEAPMVARLRY